MEKTEQRSSPFSVDLLTRLVSNGDRQPSYHDDDDDHGELELSLGLSLNGRFGTDPRARPQALKRSSSIADFTLPTTATAESSPELLRACSLPAEAEEWRRRKEVQSLRRLEAKRKRSEKQRKSIIHDNNSSKLSKLSVEPMVVVVRKDVVFPSPVSFHPSGGSHGSGSSGLSDSDSLVAQGGGHKCSEPESEHKAGSAITRLGSVDFKGLRTEIESTNKQKGALPKTSGSREMGSWNVLEDMPCVSTTGLGPNGKRVEGFLYRYCKGEEVRIVCVCHGSFLSPAEFVKHAGGGEVDYPLKHIVVNPTSFS